MYADTLNFKPSKVLTKWTTVTEPKQHYNDLWNGFSSKTHTHTNAIPYPFYLIRNKKINQKTTSVFVQQIERAERKKKKLWVIYTINKHVQTIKVMWYLGFSIYQSINTILTIMLLEFNRSSSHFFWMFGCGTKYNFGYIILSFLIRRCIFKRFYKSWFRLHVEANCFEWKKKLWALKLCSNDLKWPPLKQHFLHTQKIYFIVFMTEYKIPKLNWTFCNYENLLVFVFK